MDFSLTQDILATVDQVQAALTDPGFLAAMTELPKIGSVEVLEQARGGDTVHQRVRYLFTADLSGAVRRVVDPDKLTWVERSTSTSPRTRRRTRSNPTTTPTCSRAATTRRSRSTEHAPVVSRPGT